MKKSSMTHPAEKSEELLQCFDEQGNPTEVHPRSEVKAMPPRWWYATNKVWLVNDAGEIMVSKRAEGLSGNPGKWQTYFGGHVSAGLTIKESAQRELEEEAGVAVSVDDLVLIDRARSEEGHVHQEFYAVRFNGAPADLRFTDNEVTEAHWMSFEEYRADQAEHPDVWCNNCTPEREEKIRAWLKDAHHA